MNIKTFISTAVIALTLAACGTQEPAPTVTVEEAVSQESANADVTESQLDVLTEHVEDGHLTCTSSTPTAACNTKPK